jgi:hypothetical protein
MPYNQDEKCEIVFIFHIPPLALWSGKWCVLWVHGGLCVISHYKHAIAGKLPRTLLSGEYHKLSKVLENT